VTDEGRKISQRKNIYSKIELNSTFIFCKVRDPGTPWNAFKISYRRSGVAVEVGVLLDIAGQAKNSRM
jgi:hypothetical protein